jgi:S-(hydroxymethyl)glutathione dehydrogenase/alcohol dehydrogenase
MPITVKAAVAHGANQPMTVETLVYDDPIENEVLIRIVASGLCHSDLHILDGSMPSQFPAVLGHEAGAVVVRCGPDVKDLQPGDHVVPLFCPECGVCDNCRSGKTNICQHFVGADSGGAKLRWNGQEVVRPGGLGCFADHSVVREYSLAKVRRDAPLDRAFYAGCGVTTGVGSAMFAAKVQPGSKVIVFGLGGVGLNILQGARLAGATLIVGVDTNPERESIARRLGATHFVCPKQISGDLTQHLIELSSGGADYAFECVGNVRLIEQASAVAHPLWGVLTIVGAPPYGQVANVQPFDLLMGKKWQGTMFGGAKGRTDVPKVVDWYMEGKINIDDLVTHELPLERINEGFEMMKNGTSIRTIIRFVH